jgi:hypothetical protein
VSLRTPRFWIIALVTFLATISLLFGVSEAFGGGELDYYLAKLALAAVLIFGFLVAAKRRGRDTPQEPGPSE